MSVTLESVRYEVINVAELTLEILEEAISKLPQVSYPKQIRVSYRDYRRMRETCDILKILPEQSTGFTYGFMGEKIIPDIDVADNNYEIDY